MKKIYSDYLEFVADLIDFGINEEAALQAAKTVLQWDEYEEVWYWEEYIESPS